MKLIFCTDEDLRKLVVIWQMFGPPESPARRLAYYAPFVGKEFYLVSQIYNKISYFRKKGESKKFWLAFLNKDPTEKIRKMKKLDIVKLLGSVELPPREEGYHAQIEKVLASALKKYNRTSYWVKKIFGISLPKKAIVVPYEYYALHGMQGTCLTQSPPLIALGFGYKTKKEKVAFDVFLHELLHALVKSKLKKPKRQSRFEEALLDYFVPGGMLSEKIGLIKKFSFDEFTQKTAWRTSAAEESKKLLPVMKEYQKVCGKVTIWRFLRSKGFKKQVA